MNRAISQWTSPVQQDHEWFDLNGVSSHQLASPSEVTARQRRAQPSSSVFLVDPIWLVASVEEGGLMGITQQLEQCHSLGMNPIHPHLHFSQLMTSPVDPHFPSASTNPFQATRCKHERLLIQQWCHSCWFRARCQCQSIYHKCWLESISVDSCHCEWMDLADSTLDRFLLLLLGLYSTDTPDHGSFESCHDRRSFLGHLLICRWWNHCWLF